MLLSLFLALAVAQAAPESPFADSQWLQDPRLLSDGEALLEERLGAQDPSLDSGLAMTTLFRREVTLKTVPEQALLYVTGDDYFQLFLNGEHAVEGPARAYPSAHPYFWLEVSPFLREGLNTLAARTLGLDAEHGPFFGGTKRSGFLMALDVKYPDGSAERFVTDDNWRVLPLAGHRVVVDAPGAGAMPEHVEQAAYTPDWRQNGFDDSAWPSAEGTFQDHHFVLQTTPPLVHQPIEPYEFRKLAQNVFLYDFGLHLSGRISLNASGDAGASIELLLGNELKRDGSGVLPARGESDPPIHKIVLDGGDATVSLILPRDFRYIEIRGVATPPKLSVQRLHYPFAHGAVRFASDDEALERLWALSRNSIHFGIQDQYPGRGRPSYWGHAYLAARSHLWLTGDLRLLRKTLYDFQESLAWQSHIPTALFQDHTTSAPEHGLFVPLLLELYWQHGGDNDWTKELIDQGLPELFRRYAAYENEYGLLAGLGARSLLSELPEATRDGYRIPEEESAACPFQNVIYYGALMAAARLAEAHDRSAVGYQAKARRIEQAFAELLADPETGLYRDAPSSEHQSLPVNTLALHFGLASGVDPHAQAQQLIEAGMPGEMLTAVLGIEALFEQGYGTEAYALLQNQGPRGWHRMIDTGASSTLSHWPDLAMPNRTWLAPESAAPIWLLIEHVLGLDNAPNGLHIAPTKIAELPALELVLPGRNGSVTARFHPDEGYTVWAPETMEVHTMEDEGQKITVHQQATAVPAAPTSSTGLRPEDREHLLASGWEEQVGDGLGVWIDVDKQHFYILKDLEVIWDTVCATASKGTGAEAGSYKTPLGWHIIGQRFGEGAAWGQVFRARQATGEIWQHGMDTKEDLVLTRVLWLEGLEPGKNLGTLADGTLIDSKRRYIYIHGTNGEDVLGRPSSHGCIRLGNDAVIEAFDMLPSGVKVFISERTGESQEHAVPLS